MAAWRPSRRSTRSSAHTACSPSSATSSPMARRACGRSAWRTPTRRRRRYAAARARWECRYAAGAIGVAALQAGYAAALAITGRAGVAAGAAAPAGRGGGYRRMTATWATMTGCGRGRQGSNRVNRGGAWNSNARNLRAANRNANEPGNRNDNLGFRLAGAQTLPRAACVRSAPDQTAVATGGACRRRTQRGPRRASSGSGCAGERSPGLRLSGGRAR